MKKAQWLWTGLLAVVVVLAFAGTWAFAQAAGNPEAEIKTAIAHAGYAAKADALNGVHLHLHHVLNCVVGPQDKMFDAAAGNPCKDQGNGALPDIKAKMGQDDQYYEVSLVAQIANQGITSNSLQEAKAAAHVANLILEDAAKAK
jgi:hypothetical protein